MALTKPCPKCGSRRMKDHPADTKTHCPFCGRDGCPRDC